MYSAGIDEAGRGPVIGPMAMAIVAVKTDSGLRAMGVKDSKLLTPEQRESMAAKLEDLPHELILLTPSEIDAAVQGAGDNLNRLEARTAALLIHRLAAKLDGSLSEVIIDSPARDGEKYAAIVRAALDRLGYGQQTRLRCEIKADLNHPVVGAASIIAKVARDREIKALEGKHGPMGSGYPSDPSTQAFLRDNWREGHEFFRKSWESYKRLAEGRQQATLDSFSPAAEHAQTVQAFDALKDHGFSFEPPTNPYEVVRAKKGKVTVIHYTTGKTLLQGPDEERSTIMALLSYLKLDAGVAEKRPRGRPPKR